MIRNVALSFEIRTLARPAMAAVVLLACLALSGRAQGTPPAGAETERGGRPGVESTTASIAVLEGQLNRVGRADDYRRVGILLDLVGAYERSGDDRSAERYCREAIEIGEKLLLPPDHLYLQMAHADLASLIEKRGDPSETEALLRELLDGSKVGTRESAVERLTRHYRDSGDYAAALQLLDQEVAREGGDGCLTAVHCYPVGRYALLMGDVLIKQQSTADAVRAYERSAEAYSRGHSQVGGVRPNEMTESWAKLARALKATGRVADAETAYRKSIELWQAKLLDPYDGFDPADVFAPLLDELAALLEAQNRASEALDLRKRANAFRSLPRQTRPAVHREGITVHQPPKHP